MSILRNPFRRVTTVPAEVRAAAPLAVGEKVLAATPAGDGSWLLGTRDALYVVPEQDPSSRGAETGGTDGPTRIPWEQVERADWDRDEERFVVSEVGQFGLARPQYTFPVSEPGLLLELVRERVTASVVLQRRVAVQGKRGLVVVARRAPAGGGEITWAYEFDPGVDPDEPAVMALAEAALRSAQGEIGA